MARIGRPPTPLEVRFWQKVKRTDSCWNWTGALQMHSGYGRIRVGSRTHPAHRVSWELLRGPIPEGLHIDHLCRNRRCVNPDHLEPVTCRENLMRGIGFVPVNAAKTHCAQGHPYDETNTLVRRCGARTCRACLRERKRRRREQQRAQQAMGGAS